MVACYGKLLPRCEKTLVGTDHALDMDNLCGVE